MLPLGAAGLIWRHCRRECTSKAVTVSITKITYGHCRPLGANCKAEVENVGLGYSNGFGHASQALLFDLCVV